MELLTTSELIAATDALPYPRKPTPVQREEWNAAIRELESKWAAWLKKESAHRIPAPLHQELFEKAWDDGHSNGYEEVERYYNDYVDFAEHIIKIFIAENGR